MNKIDVINEILNVYEENNNLKNTIEFLKSKDKKEKEIVNLKEDNDSLEKRIYRIGLENLFNNCFSGTYISRWKDEPYQSLENWSENNINLHGLYKEISQKEFEFLFGDRIKNAYDKAIEKAKEREKKEDE